MAEVVDWKKIAGALDERVPKYGWPEVLGKPRCPRCGGMKCRLLPRQTYRCIYCCYEARVPGYSPPALRIPDSAPGGGCEPRSEGSRRLESSSFGVDGTKGQAAPEDLR